MGAERPQDALRKPTFRCAGALARNGTVVVLVAVCCYLGWTLFRVAGHDSLTSIADDSSNYLVMARRFSPWVPAGAAMQSVWPLQYFPPLFPLLLALTGAAHSLLAAHLLVVALGVLALAALRRFLIRAVGLERLSALFLVLLFALSPGFLLGLQGILSESTFLLLSLLFLGTGDRAEGRPLLAAALLAGAMLTRSAGMVLLLAAVAYALVAALRERRALREVLRVPVLASLGFAGANALLAPPAQGEYAQIWQGLVMRGAEGGLAAVNGFLGAQAVALAESWCAFFAVYWRADSPAAPALAALAGGLALCGMAMRLYRNRIDAWYAAGMLAMLLLWPYPGQMMRLLFPVVPILLAQAAWFLVLLSARLRIRHVLPVAGLALAVVILPPHAYLHGRLALARELGCVPVYEWLRTPALEAARRELGVQNQMLRDFAQLRVDVAADAVVAYYEPAYVALLAERQAIRAPFPFEVATLGGRADYALLTAIHPRQSRAGLDGLAVADAGPAPMQRIWCHAEPLAGHPASCLFRIH